MATENKRVAAYLPQPLYDLLEKFKEGNGLSESKAIISILAAHFGLAQEVSQKVAHQFVTVEQFDQLQKKVTYLSELIGELSQKHEGTNKEVRQNSDLISELKSDIEINPLNSRTSSQTNIFEIPTSKTETAHQIKDEEVKEDSLIPFETDLSCPSCGSTRIGKNGYTVAGKQRYRCKDCAKRFVER